MKVLSNDLFSLVDGGLKEVRVAFVLHAIQRRYGRHERKSDVSIDDPKTEFLLLAQNSDAETELDFQNLY